MNFIRRLFHRCNFNIKVAPMHYKCKCGRERWGLFDESRR